MHVGVEGAKSVLLEFGFVSFDGGALEGSLWLSPFVLGLDVRVECGIGEVSFSAAAQEVPAFFVLARPSGGHLIVSVALLLHL